MIGAIAAAGCAAACVVLVTVALRASDRARVRSAIAGPRVGVANRATRRVLDAATRVAAVAAVAAAGHVVAGAGGAAAGALACVVGPNVRRRRRRSADAAALADGLADAVSAMAGALRVGRSMTGALEEAASTVGPPLGPRLEELLDRIAMGVPVDRAVLDLMTAVPGPDGRLVGAVLGLHQRSGGDAPAVLDRVARTLRERRASARELRSLTAQARLSGAILGFLPIGFFLFLSVTARSDVERALSSTAGRTAVALGLCMQGLAFLWIRTLLRIDA
jgi:tight adherence protein B